MPEVSCDICGDPMQKQADVYACYPCKHMIWESELPFYSAETDVPIPSKEHYEEVMCRSQSKSTPSNSSP